MSIMKSRPYTILILVRLFYSMKMLNEIINIKPNDCPPNNKLPPEVAYPTGNAV
jgi:hypothetical protein